MMKLNFILYFVLIANITIAQITIRGKVVYNDKPIEGVKVQFWDSLNSLTSVVTDSSGRYSIIVPYLDDKLEFYPRNKYWNTYSYLDSSYLEDPEEIVTELDKKPFLKRIFKINRRKYKVTVCGFCFIKGTQIIMSDGSCKPIEKISEGDMIFSFNEVLQKQEISAVEKMDSVIHDNIIRLTFSDGTELESTDDHPYWVNEKGWCSLQPEQTFALYGIRCEKLKKGDNCVKWKDGILESVQIHEIKKLNKEVITYNISEISIGNSYFANGIAVSNEGMKNIE